MYTQNELKTTIKNMNKIGFLGMLFTVNPCIKRLLPVINHQDEELLMCEFHLFSSMGCGDLFLTPTRLIFLEGAGLLHKDYEIYLSNVASFESSQGFNRLYAVEITDNGGKKYVFKNLKEHSSSMLIKYCQQVRNNQNNVNMNNSPISEADEIKKFAELYEKGLITEEEFNKKKAKILGI